MEHTRNTNFICRHANAKTTEDGTAWAATVLPVTLGRRLMVHHLHVLAMHLPRICQALAMQINALQMSMPGGILICKGACQAESCLAEQHAGLNVALQTSIPGGMLLFKRATLKNQVASRFYFHKMMKPNPVCEQK